MYALPLVIAAFLLETLCKLLVGDPHRFGLNPKSRITKAHLTINGELIQRIAVGAVTPCSNIASVGEDTVEFEDGTVVEADAIILCTGYKIAFPYLSSDLTQLLLNGDSGEHGDNEVGLYKHVFPVLKKFQSAAFLGLIQPLGAIMPISELQVRWVTRVFTGKSHLPSTEEMRDDVLRKQIEMKQRYVDRPRHTIQVDYIPYMDELAEQVGCKPSFFSMLLKDPRTAFSVLLSPQFPPMYRLVGPHASKESLRLIHELNSNVFTFVNPQQSKLESSQSSHFPWKIVVLLLLAPCFLCLHYWK